MDSQQSCMQLSLERLKIWGKTWIAYIGKRKVLKWKLGQQQILEFSGKKLFPILKGYCPLSKAKFEQDKKQTKQGMFLKKVRKL